MGEAKKRAAAATRVVYHHTSTLRTNLIWMSGVIDLEGRSNGALHPLLGEVQTDVTARRACRDFPPLVWFTSEIQIPNVLRSVGLIAQSKDTGKRQRYDGMYPGADARTMADGLALHRVALGVPLENSTIVRWKDHPGYATAEGRELNETAREAGDDPSRWYVSEEPVDVLTATEVWTAGSIFRPKLQRRPEYLRDVHRMVQLCRQLPGTLIPPSWINDPQVQEMVRQSKRAADAQGL